jgi:hypothetical protein
VIGLVPTVGSLIKGVAKQIYQGAKLDELLALFNFFKKGNGVQWLKKLHAGQLKSYLNEAAVITHKIFATCIDKTKTIQDYVPSYLTDLHSEVLGTLDTVKGKIDGMFSQIGDELNEKLGKILSHSSEAKAASAKGTFSVKQASNNPNVEVKSIFVAKVSPAYSG